MYIYAIDRDINEYFDKQETGANKYLSKLLEIVIIYIIHIIIRNNINCEEIYFNNEKYNSFLIY